MPLPLNEVVTLQPVMFIVQCLFRGVLINEAAISNSYQPKGEGLSCGLPEEGAFTRIDAIFLS